MWNIQDGVDLFNKINYVNARNFFVGYIANNPNDEKGYYELARTYLKLGNTILANKNFEKSYNLASKDKTLEKIKFKDDSQTSKDYFDMAAMYFEEGNLKEADFYADLILKLNNKDANGWFLKAKVACSKGQNEDAVNYLNNAILYDNKLLNTNLAKKLNINSAPAVSRENYYLFAFEDYYKGKIDSAIYNCEKYIELDKENPDINMLLAELYLEKNETTKALKTLENIKKASDNSSFFLLQARIYDILNQTSKQEKALKKAYKLNPNNSKMLYEMGNFYLKKENYSNSIKYFEALINTDDNFYEGYFGYIKCLIELGKTDKALNYIRKATAINSNQSEINYLLSLICYKLGQFSDSNDYIKEAQAKHKNPNYLLLEAKNYYYLGDYNNSLDALSKIAKLPLSTYKSYEVDEFYIKNYIKLKQYQNMQRNLNNKDIALDKNSLLYKYNLYKIYKSEGNDKKADFLYKQIKLTRLNSTKEYLDLSEIIYEEEGLDVSIKLLDKAIKKTPQEAELYSQKIKIYYLAHSFEEAKKISNEMSEKFN